MFSGQRDRDHLPAARLLIILRSAGFINAPVLCRAWLALSATAGAYGQRESRKCRVCAERGSGTSKDRIVLATAVLGCATSGLAACLPRHLPAAPPGSATAFLLLA